jgi:Tol biopolymer transport system component
MGRLPAIILIIAALGGARIISAEQGANDLFQKALSKERAEGQLDDAIVLYARVVKEYASDRPLVAKALMQLGACYEKLGRAEARAAYERVVREFSDQGRIVVEAGARLAALARPRSVLAGLSTRQVWAGPGSDASGSPSPDGRYLSFVDWSTGDLAVRDLTTGATRQLTRKGSWAASPAFAEHPLFSPDGRRIVYTWNDPRQAEPQSSSWDLRIIDRDGSNARVILPAGDTGYIWPTDWSPDGRTIVATLYRADGTNQIALVSVEHRSMRVLKTFDWRPPNRMRFSADGRHIVYDFPPREDSQNRDIFLLATDGSAEVPLVEHPSDDSVLGWMPGSNRVLFASDRAGTVDAWMVPAPDEKAGQDPQNPQLLKRDLGAVSPMGFTRAGAFYYAAFTGMRDVCISAFDPKTLDAASAPSCVSTKGVGANYEAFWSPDGRVLGYITERNRLAGNATTAFGAPVITLNAFDGSPPRELAPKLSIIRRPSWCPDGRAIVVRGYGDNRRSGVYVVDPQTGAATLLTRNGHDPVCASDGSVFYRMGENEKDSSIWVRGRDGGEERERYRGPASELSLSPDGRWLAFSTRGPNASLAVLPTSGGPVRTIYRWPGSVSARIVTWLPDSRQLLFGHEDVLWSVAIDGGEPRRLALASTGLRFLTLSPDGRRLAFTAGERTSEVWVMENLPTGPLKSTSRR